MKPYAQEAEDLRLLLLAGIVSVDDVVAWADQKILTLPEYDDDLAEISLGAEVSMAEMDQRLRRTSAGADKIEAVRRLLGRMHQFLLSNEFRAGEFARVLDSLWRELPELPDDFDFMPWIYDCFLDPESFKGEPIDIFIEKVAPFDTTWRGLTQAKSGKILGRLRRFFRRGRR
jgi:hypothetical protein